MKERSAEEAPNANVPRTDSALPLCIAISICCFKKKADLGSPESVANRRPAAAPAMNIVLGRCDQASVAIGKVFDTNIE